MADLNPVAGASWAFTDVEGRIEAMSRSAQMLFGIRHVRGDDFLARLPLSRKTLRFDIAMALGGWPAQRTVTLERLHGVVNLRYRVSRQFEARGGERLYWHLHTMPASRTHAA